MYRTFLLVLLAGCPKPPPPSSVTEQIPSLSGLSVLEETDSEPTLLAVADAKKAGEPRLFRIWGKTILPFDGALASAADLEGLTQMDGDTWWAITSNREVHPFDLVDGKPKEGKVFSLDGGPETEGFAAASVGGAHLLVWGARGVPGREGGAIWAAIVAEDGTVGEVTALGPVEPKDRDPCERSIGALWLLGDGTLYAAATVDPDDCTPMRSQIYTAGVVVVAGGTISFIADGTRLDPKIDDHKVEGLTRDGAGSWWLAYDDETGGGIARWVPQP